MISVALCGQRFAQQLAAAPEALSGVNVLWCGASLEALRREALPLRPEALALDLGDLAGVTPAELTALLGDSGAQLVVVTYSFATRAAVRALRSERVRVVQGPLTLAALRAHLSFLVVKDLLVKKESPVSEPTVAPRRFTPEQLGKLLEVASAVQCECPNHLAQLVSGLQGFEDYSAGCANRNDADAAMHRRLYRSSAEARRVMEDALAALIEFERIAV